MRISFDFDGCLGHNLTIQKLAKILVDAGQDIWILTSRSGKPVFNKDLEEVALRVGIPLDKVIYVGSGSKLAAIIKHNIDMHYDDDHIEIEDINHHFKETKPGVFVGFNMTFMTHLQNGTLDQYSFEY